MLTERGHKIAIHIAFVVLAVGVVLQSLLLPQAIGVNPGSNTATHEKSEKQLIDRRIADYTLGLAFFTRVLALSTIGLWVVTDLALRHSRDIAERELRAYISHEPNGARMHPVTGDLCYFEYNFGKTPAREVRMFLRVKDGADPPPNFNGPYDPINFMPYIAPGQNIGKTIPGHQFKRELFLYGYVDYTDAFERKWRRRFAVSYDAGRPIGGTICGCGVTNTTMNTSARAMALGQFNERSNR